MRVLHVGPRPDPRRGNGVDIATWPVIQAQARAGSDVAMLLGNVRQGEAATANSAGVDVLAITEKRWRYDPKPLRATLARWQPDVVHVHSVFIPAQAQLCATLYDRQIPYVVSPHGGLNLFRGGAKKAVYGALLEKRRFERSGALFVLTDAERREIEGWMGDRTAHYVEMPNPVPDLPSVGPWELPAEPVFVYLGRYDVEKKGLDRLVEMARIMPEAQFRCYGSATGSEVAGYEKLVNAGLPSNITFNEPVFNEDKVAAVQAATMYIHPARNEGFGMSIVEAMKIGVPTAVASSCDLAPEIARLDGGLVFSAEPRRAVDELRQAVGQPAQLKQWANAGQRWVREFLNADRLARRSLEAYSSVLGAHRSARHR